MSTPQEERHEPAPALTGPAALAGSDALAGPRLVFFHIAGRRDLAQRAAAASPGVRFAARRSWTSDPGESRRSLLGGREPAVGLWHWSATAEELAAQATAILLGFVHPLVGRSLPFCIGFGLGPEVFAPRSLGFGDAALLDLEDIGRLLGVAAPAKLGGRRRPRRRASGNGPARPGARTAAPAPAQDGIRLDAAQSAAVAHGRGPARVLAPAGSGKTKTLVSRVAEIVARGADPSGILLLAFNRKAAEQLEERLAALGIATTRRLGAPPSLGHDDEVQCRPPGVHCATFNAFGYRYQREILQTHFTLDLDGAGLRALMKRAMEVAGVSLAELKPARGSDPVGAFLSALTRVRAALEPPDGIAIDVVSTGETPLITVPFAPIHSQYLRAQAATGRQSFDDQIYLAVADMLADPVHRAFVEQRFDHVLVDEFQDLNGAQLALIDLLSRPGRELFVVGDDDQLIYGWRHADPRGILEFHQRMPPRPWSATYTLCTNYRCSRAVVESGARLVENNVVREPKDVRPRKGAQEGALTFAGAPSWPERAAATCAFLRAEQSRLACEWRELAVLCRYRSQQIPVALALDADGIPRTPMLGCSLFTHPGARLLRAYIDLIRAPEAAPAGEVANLLNRPNRYLSNAVVEAVGAASRPWVRIREGAAKEPASGPRPFSALVEQVERLGALLGTARSDDVAARRRRDSDSSQPDTPQLTSEQSVWAVVDAFGLEEYWAGDERTASSSSAHDSGRSSGSADPTSQTAAQTGGRDDAGPLEILDALLLLAEMRPEPGEYLGTWDRLRADEEAHAGMSDDTLEREQSEEDRVVIGTIHAAKGREYNAVVIPEYACDTSRWEPAEVEEERRVVYVGVTRARDSVLFTVDTTTMYVQPFLRELVETPAPEEHATLSAWLEQEDEADLCRRIVERLTEIDVVFPELVPHAPDDAAAASADAATRPQPAPPLT